MAYTLAYLDTPVPTIPRAPSGGGALKSDQSSRDTARPADRREHFGTEAAALRRAAEMLPGPPWLDLRLYGPDGARLAGQAELTNRLCPTGPDPSEETLS